MSHLSFFYQLTNKLIREELYAWKFLCTFMVVPRNQLFFFFFMFKLVGETTTVTRTLLSFIDQSLVF